MKVEINDNLIIEDFDEGMIILNMNTGKYLEANELGCKIFAGLTKYNDTDLVYLDLKDEFDVANDILKRDIESFIKDLERYSILKIKK